VMSNEWWMMSDKNWVISDGWWKLSDKWWVMKIEWWVTIFLNQTRPNWWICDVSRFFILYLNLLVIFANSLEFGLIFHVTCQMKTNPWKYMMILGDRACSSLCLEPDDVRKSLRWYWYLGELGRLMNLGS